MPESGKNQSFKINDAQRTRLEEYCRNRGWEFTLSTVNVDTRIFKWRSDFNISFNKNKILSLNDGESRLLSSISSGWDMSKTNLYLAQVGQSIGQFIGLIWEGVYTYDDFNRVGDDYVLRSDVAANGSSRSTIRPGDIKYRDVNGDGTITDKDVVVIGRATPIHIGGFNNEFTIGPVSVSFLLQWSYGNDIMNANRIYLEGNVTNRPLLNQFKSYADRWTEDNPDAILPQAAEYIRFYLAGLPFLMVYDLSKQLVMACGNSKTPLYAVLATSVLNILLDLAWVTPFGVAGAAAATALSQAAGCLFMLWYLRRGLLTGPFRLSMLDRRCLWEVFRLSAPNAIQQASAPVGGMVKQGLLGGIGVAAIAGFSCAGKMSSLLLMPVYGFTQSLVFFIAQNTAAGQDARVREGARQARGIMLVYALLVTAGCILLARPMLRLFTADEAAIAYGALLLSRQAVVYAFTAMKHYQEASLRGRQQMGLYLASNLGGTAADLLACLVLVPLCGYSGFYLASFVSAPASFLLAAGLARAGAKRSA